MEKTWAKLHGMFAKIDGGLSREALHDMTGAPTKNYRPDVGMGLRSNKNKEIWKRIRKGEKRDVKIN